MTLVYTWRCKPYTFVWLPLLAALFLTGCNLQEKSTLPMSIQFEHENGLEATAQAHNYELQLSQNEAVISFPEQINTHTFSWKFKPQQEVVRQNEGVIYKEAFDDADLKFYDKGNGNIGYDVILEPKSDITNIQFTLGEDAQAFIADNGQLIIPLDNGELRHSAPYAYQEIDGQQIEVDSRFALAEGILSFEVGAYDEDYALVIDPEIMLVLAPCVAINWNDPANKSMITAFSDYSNNSNPNFLLNGLSDQVFYFGNNQNDPIAGEEMIKFQFPQATILSGFEINMQSNSFFLNSGAVVNVQGSNDNANWTTIQQYTGTSSATAAQFGAPGNSEVFAFSSNTIAYTYYRILGVSGTSNWSAFALEAYFGTSNANQSSLANISCDQNGTTYAAADDYITFSLDPCGGTGTYTVTASGTTIATPGGTLGASAIGNFGGPTFFRLGDGSAGGGDVTITISGFLDGMDVVEVIADPGNCLPESCAGTDYNDLSNKASLILSTMARTSGTGTIDVLKDGNIANETFFFPSGTANNLEYIRVQFPQAEVLTGLEIATSATNTWLFNNGTNVAIQGSNDGSTWTDLVNVTEDGATSPCIFGTCPNAESYSFPNNTTAYTFYRVFSISGNGNNPWVNELFFQSRNPQSGLTNVVCNDGGTPFNGADDFLSFTLNPEGGTGSYNLIVDGYTPTNGSTGMFGIPTTFTLPAGSAGNGDINIFIQNTLDNCDITETITDPGFCFPECGISISNAYVTCSAIDNYTVNFQVNWDYSYASAPPAASPILLTVAGQSLANFQPNMDVGSQTFSAPIITPTLGALITAEFQNFSDCNANRIIDIIPSATCAPVAACGFGGIGGKVFNDFDNDGVDDGASEVGQGAIRVDLFEDNNNTPVATTHTNSDGNWLFTGFTTYPYRVEFSIPSGSPLETSMIGADNGGDVQFLTTGAGACNINYGVLDPSLFTQNNPLISVVCFTRNNDPDTEGAIVFVEEDDATAFVPASTSDASFEWSTVNSYNNSNYPITYVDAANKGQVSTTLGLDWDVPNQRLLTGSYYRAFAPMAMNSSSNGFGEAIISQVPLDVENKTAGTPSVWLDLENCFGDDFAGVFQADNNYPGSSEYGLLGQYPENVGAVGLGSLKMSKDFSEVYVVNLNTNEVLVIPVNPDGSASGNASDIKRFPIPNTNCSGSWADGRPYARALGLGVHPVTGRVYATLTCTGPTPADMTGFIYSFDPSDDTPSVSDFVKEMEFSLNFARPYTNTNQNSWYTGNVYSWVPLTPNTVPYANSGGDAVGHISPWLAEVGFTLQPDGEYAMVIAERNRYTDQIASSFFVHGSILYRATRNNGVWTLENNGVSGNATSTVNWTFDDPDKAGSNTSSSNRFFKYVGTEGSMINGTFDSYQGSDEVIAPAMDNLSFNATSGLAWLNTTNGERTQDVRILSDETNPGFFETNFAKANNWGGLAVMTQPSTIQVGNYVWDDTDGDGIQDPGESGISGVTVKLHDANGLLVGLTTTSASGEYYFDETNVDITGVNSTTGAANNSFTGMTQGEKYFIVLMADNYNAGTGDVTIGSTTYQLSPLNPTGGNSQNDSDAANMTIPNVGDMPSIMFTADVTDLTFDIGLASPLMCNLTINTTTPDALCTGGTYDVQFALTWTDAPITGDFEVSIDGGATFTTVGRTELTASSSETITLTDVVCDGAMKSVTIRFADDDACSATSSYTAPALPVCNLTINSSTPDALCTGGTYDVQFALTWTDAPITGDFEVSIDGGSTFTTVGRTELTASSSETITLTDVVCDGAMKSVTIRFADDDACSATSSYTAPALPVCNLTINTTTPDALCTGGTYDVQFALTWTDAPITGDFEVSIDGGSTFTTVGRTELTASSSETITLTDVVCDGAMKSVTIRFADDDACSATSSYTAPALPVCNLTINSSTPDALCTGGTYDVQFALTWTDAPITGDFEVSIDGASTFTTVGRTELTASSSETITLTDVVCDGAMKSVTIRFVDDDACSATSSYMAPVLPTVNTCDLSITALDITCSNAGADYTVSFDLNWDYATATSETIIVEIDGVAVSGSPFTPTAAMSGAMPIEVMLMGQTPGFGKVITARFSSTTDCSTTQIFDLVPDETCVPVCVDDLGGNVFNDFDNDGEDDGASETGQPNILVEIYECDNDTPVATTYTNTNGDWSIDLTGLTIDANNPVRVEFSTPLTPWLEPSAAGTDNGTDVQFVDAASCEVDFGVINPDACVSSDGDPSSFDVSIVVPCHVNGNVTAGGTNDALILVDYDATGESGAHKQVLATKSEIGSTYGAAVNRKAGEVYVGAFLKRHVGLRETGLSNPLGGIFVHDFTTGSNDIWLDLTSVGATVGTVSSNTTRGLGGTTTPTNDPETFPLIGKVGLGDMDISTDNDTLFVVSLADKTVYALSTSDKSLLRTYPTPTPNCIGGEFRPFGLKYHDGELYLGGVCDAETSQNIDDLIGYVYRWTGSAWTQVISIPFNYMKGAVNRNCPNEDTWYAWTSTFPANCNGDRVVYPQPLISDIEFLNNGDMIIGVMDRTGHQIGYNNRRLTGTALVRYFAGGDILRASFNGTNYILESNAEVGGITTAGQNNMQGVGGGEFYFADDYLASDGIAHEDVAQGSLVYSEVTNEIITTSMNPVRVPTAQIAARTSSGGLRKLSNTDGSYVDGYMIYRGGFGKSAGLGDSELYCSSTPIQVGNYVWNDLDQDGVQDACEDPISGLTVKLYDDAGLLIGVDVTDTDGEYYFDISNVDTTGVSADGTTPTTAFSGLNSGEKYFIVFMGDSYDDTTDEITVVGRMYELTTANSGEGNNPDQNDSDVSEMNVPNVGDMPVIMFVADSTDHTLDAGLIEAPRICPDIAAIIPAATIVCTGEYTFPPITGTDLDGNEAYYSLPNGNGTKYLAGDMVMVTQADTFYAYAAEDTLIRNTAGLALWLDGTDINADGTIPTDGADIATWADKSGNGNNATSVAANRNPAYDATAQGLQFAGTDILTGTAGFNSNTLFIVFEPDNEITSASSAISLISNSSSVQNSVTLGTITSTLAGEVVTLLNNSNNVNNRDAISSSNLASITPSSHILGIRADGTNDAEMYFDGTMNLQDLTVGDNDLLTNLAYALGTDNSGGRFFPGIIKEVISYDNTLSTTDFFAIQNLLDRKWNGSTICKDEESFRIILPQLDLSPMVVCANETDFTVTVTVDWEDVDFANDDIEVTLLGETMTINPTTEDGTEDVVFTFNTPAFDALIEVQLSNSTDCSNTAITDLIACGMACVDDLGGTVFNDFDNNGVEDAGETGQPNILVEIYECDSDTPVATSYTNASGDWSIDDMNITYPVRVEFSTPLTPWLDPSVAGTDNGTDVQFIDAPSCEVDFGVIDPGVYCQTSPDLITSCFVNGNTTTSLDALVRYPYGSNGIGQGGIINLANNDQIGSTAGLAYAREANQLYLGAFLKRHVGLVEGLPGNPLGRIFLKDLNGANGSSTSGVSQFINLEDYGANVGTIPTNATRGLGGLNAPSEDNEAYTKIGEVGIGDLDISEDEQFLYAISINDKQLFTIEIDADNNPATAPAAGDVTSVTIPDPGCQNGVWRPFGLKVHQGDIYIGGICDASNLPPYTDQSNDLRAYVYRYDGTTFTEVYDFPLTYYKGRAFREGANGGAYWINWTDLRASNGREAGNSPYIFDSTMPQPILSDIEFDIDGAMILGFMDRYGHQIGQQNYAFGTTTFISGVVSGDILRAARQADGTYLTESAGISDGITGYVDSPENYDEGPGGGEFYNDNFRNGARGHGEISYGHLAFHPSRRQVLFNAMDPVDVSGGNDQAFFRAGGTIWLDGSNGQKVQAFHLFRDGNASATGIGKASGLGDLELLCAELPIQVGNYVWNDLDQDGVQDACEDPISGLTVKLYTKPQSGNAQLVATTTTDADGEYYFTGAGTTGETWETGFTEIVSGDSYFIVFMGDSYDDANDEITVGSTTYSLTTANMGEGNNRDQNDSDVSEMVVTGVGMMPVIMFTADETDHTFDAGLVEPEKVALGNFVFMDNNEDGVFNTGNVGFADDMPLEGVVVELFNGGDNPLTATALASFTTLADGYYYYDNLEPGDYFVFITEENFQTGGALENKVSSTGSTDPDDDTTDDDDNGIDDANPETNGISSPVVTLTPGGEPTDEAGQGGDDGTYPGTLPDENVNETVDFSFETEKVALGNFVFMDNNEDGVFNTGNVGFADDMPLEGVVVELFNGGDNPLTATALASFTTLADGYYYFDNLEPGDYFVFIPEENFQTGGALENKLSSTGSTDPDDDTTDDDDNGIDDPNPETNGISSPVVTLTPGGEPTDEAGQGGDDGTYPGTLPDENVNETVDFSFENAITEVALGNLVYMDTNEDGDFDDGIDMGLDGVVVELYNQGENPATTMPVASQTTQNGGFYLFDNLPEGTYFVFLPAANFGTNQPLEDKLSSPGVDSGDADDNAPTSDNGQDDPTPENNGVRSPDIVLEAGNEPTGESGEDTPMGQQSSLPDENVNETIDFSFITEKVALGNLVFMDTNGDGDFDPGQDMAIDGVIVQLFNTGDDPTSDSPVAIDQTQNGGFYLFDELEPGDYFVFIPASQFIVSAPLDGKVSSTPEGGDNDTDDDTDENGENTPVAGGTRSGDINLSPNDEPTGESGEGTYTGTLPDENVNLTVDLGFQSPPTEKVALGNLVFMDTNSDGDFDPGVDMGIDNVTVQLFKAGENPLLTIPTAIQVTTGSGFYLFDELDPGQYFVYIPAQEFLSSGDLAGKISSTPEGTDDGVDDNGNENGENAPVAGGTKSGTINLQPGSEPTGEPGQGTYPGTLADENVNLTVDLGFEAIPDEKVALGNLVFMDNNKDGNFDAGVDMGLDNVTVELYRAGDDPAVDAALDATTTTGGGFYLFDQLDPGEYFVFIPANEFTSTGDLAGKISSDPVGMDDNIDDGSDENGENTPVAGGVKSGTINLQPNSEPTGESTGTYSGTLDDDNVNLTVDLGFEEAPDELVALGNLVFMDTNSDGDFDPGVDMGIEDVTVQLFRAGDDPTSVMPVDTRTTTAGGFYLFDELQPGEYFVYIPADEFTTGDLADKVSLTPEGSDDGVDDDQNENGQNTPVGGGTRSGVVNLQPGSEPTGETGQGTYTGTLPDENVNLTVDLGFETEKVALGNFVFMDNNEDGDYDDGTDMPIQGVLIELFESGDDPMTATPVDMTTTDMDGYYYFDNLEPGDYFVYIQEENFQASGALENKLSSTGSTDPDDDATDDDDNGIDDANPETNGISSPVVTLTPGDEPTDEAGQGGDDGTYPGTLPDENVNETVDFSFEEAEEDPILGSLGNYVWLDENSDGFQDAGEPGIPNVEVILKDATGTEIDRAITDADGDYLFPNLGSSVYYVMVDETTLPDGLTQTDEVTNNVDGDDADTDEDDGDFGNKDNDANGGLGYKITLDEGEENLTADFGYNFNPTEDVDDPTTGSDPTAALGDRVWYDADQDGVQDPEEAGVEGVELKLIAASEVTIGGMTFLPGVEITTTVTDANGNYIFDGLAPGAYNVMVADDDMGTGMNGPLEGFEQTGDPDHFATSEADNPDDSVEDDNMTTKPVVLGPGDVFLNVDFGYDNDDALGAIGDYVWLDADADGSGPNAAGADGVPVNQGNGTEDDAAETPIEGVTVALVKDTNGDGKWDTGEPIIATDVTDEDGLYFFPALPAGNGEDYLVVITDTDNVLDGLKPTYDADGGTMEVDVFPASQMSNMELGISAVTDLPAGAGNEVVDQDFGYTPEAQDMGEGLIGDKVFLDDDGNEMQDGDEPGIEGVIVELYKDLDNNGTLEPSELMTPFATTTTDENGNYYFGGLALDMTYQVIIPTDQGDNPVLEGLENVVDPGDEDDNIGDIVTLTPTDPVDLDQDFGYQPPMGEEGSIGTLIWEDTNADGNFDDGETPIEGVTVDLYRDLNSDGKVNPGEPKIGSTTTGAVTGSGIATSNYLFENLPFGEYVIDVTDEDGVLVGYWHSLGDQAEDSADGESKSDPYGAMMEAVADQGVTIDAGSPDYINADFGYYVDPAAVGNFVFEDVNSDGIQDAGDLPIEGVEVQLMITYPDGTMITLISTTDADGFYEFPNLLLDEDYRIGAGTPEEAPASTATNQPAYTIKVLESDQDGNELDGLIATIEDAGVDELLDSQDPDGAATVPVQGSQDTQAQDPASNEADEARYDIGFITATFDYGDLPSPYPTTATDPDNYQPTDGPRHKQDPNRVLKIGTAATDTEANGQPTGNANGDDSDTAPNDEDGVMLAELSSLQPGSNNLTVPVMNMTDDPATLYVLVDWNGDGDFEDVYGAGATESFEFTVPANSSTPLSIDLIAPQAMETPSGGGDAVDPSGQKAFRLRITTQDISAAPAVGEACDGEVEDYLTSVPLPVELVSFTAKAQDCEAVLNWATASEENFSHFEVERSTDGKVFEKVGKVRGTVNSLTYNEYRFIDELTSEVQYYRLKMVDLDESYEYSEMRAVESDCKEEQSGLTVFPSPLDQGELLTVRFYSNSTNSKLLITDMTGKQMMRVRAENINKGWNELKIDVTPLAAGIYFVIDEQGQTERFVVAKQ